MDLNYTAKNMRKEQFTFYDVSEIKKALEHYKAAETVTKKLPFLDSEIEWTGKVISAHDVNILYPFLHAFVDYKIEIGQSLKIGPVESGAHSECAFFNENNETKAIVRVLREDLFFLAIRDYLTLMGV